jgi:hypothetical protein
VCASRLFVSALAPPARDPCVSAFSCCSRPRPRRRQGQSSHVRPQGCLGAPGALGRRQRAIGVYFTLETVEERGAGRLGRLFGVTLGVEAVGSQAGAKGSLCRGQPPSIMHGHLSLPVATPPVAFRPPRTPTRTQIRGARYSCQWTRDGRSGAEPLRDGAPIDSQHLSQEPSQQCSQTSSRDGFSGSTITQCGSARPGNSQQHSQDYSQQHSQDYSQIQVTALWMEGLGRSDGRGGVAPIVVDGPATATIAFGVLWLKAHNDPRG